MSEDLEQDLRSLRIDRKRKAPPGKSRLWLPAGLLTLAAAMVALALIFFPRGLQRLGLAAKPREVELMRVKRSTIAQNSVALTAGGYVIPRRRIEVSSKISGRVEQLMVERGDEVQAGQILATLDDREIRAQLSQAQAMREAADARLKEALAGSRPQEIERAAADLQQAEANLRIAKTNLARADELFKKGVLARQALDDAQNAHDVAGARVEIARRDLELARIGPRQEQIDLARAQLAEAQAAVGWLEAQLENTRIRAPVSGTVLERLIERGEMVTTGYVSGRGAKAALVSIADLGDLEVELDISEADISKVRMGQQCTVSPDAYPDRGYPGVVREIAPEANRQKATIQVKVSIRQPDHYLRPETNAKVNFLAAPRRESAGSGDGIFVPRTALIAGPALFVVQDGKALRREVRSGKEMQGLVEILSGLQPGESVIVGGVEGLVNGVPVQPKD